MGDKVQSDEIRAGCKADEYRIRSAPAPYAISSSELAEQFVLFRRRCLDDYLRLGLPVRGSGRLGDAFARVDTGKSENYVVLRSRDRSESNSLDPRGFKVG